MKRQHGQKLNRTTPAENSTGRPERREQPRAYPSTRPRNKVGNVRGGTVWDVRKVLVHFRTRRQSEDGWPKETGLLKNTNSAVAFSRRIWRVARDDDEAILRFILFSFSTLQRGPIIRALSRVKRLGQRAHWIPGRKLSRRQSQHFALLSREKLAADAELWSPASVRACSKRSSVIHVLSDVGSISWQVIAPGPTWNMYSVNHSSDMM